MLKKSPTPPPFYHNQCSLSSSFFYGYNTKIVLHKVVIKSCRRIRRSSLSSSSSSSKIIITFGNSTTWHFLVLHASIFVYWTAAVHKNCLWPLTHSITEKKAALLCMLLSKALLLSDEEIFIECSYFIPQHLWPNLCQIDDSVIGQGVLKFIHT